jgi:hypothetical protein
VKLSSPDRLTRVGIEIVTIWHHTLSVNNLLLGYSSVEVTILKVKKRPYFLVLENGDVNLVLRDTSSVQIWDTRTFVRDHVDRGLQIQEYVDLFFLITIPSKRTYQPTKRTKIDPIERKEKERRLKAKK